MYIIRSVCVMCDVTCVRCAFCFLSPLLSSLHMRLFSPASWRGVVDISACVCVCVCVCSFVCEREERHRGECRAPIPSYRRALPTKERSCCLSHRPPSMHTPSTQQLVTEPIDIAQKNSKLQTTGHIQTKRTCFQKTQRHG
ncbi:hypothetical protein QBC39DRAFT_48407 [Podospora conica]|nr:hypothetical protein QBC39DRAFT_48407 [Schizothecium conicum]